jgi:hypothetical protein
MATQNETRSIPFSEIAQGLNQAFDSADPQRLTGLQNLQRVRTAKDTLLEREQARLSAKLGPDHPRVAALAFKRSANQDFKRDLSLGISRAQTPVVGADPDAWILHGFVRNAAHVGLPNLTIGLYDAKNQWIKELGYTCTDQNGYFQLRVQGVAAAGETTKLDAKTGAQVVVTATGGQVFIHVLSGKGGAQYVDSRALQPKLGQVDYREIVLDDAAGGCAPPPDGDPEPPKTGRYLGNSHKLELHDLKNATPRCQIDAIKAEHRVYFTTQKEATAAGYDFCAYCFGKDKSKR